MSTTVAPQSTRPTPSDPTTRPVAGPAPIALADGPEPRPPLRAQLTVALLGPADERSHDATDGPVTDPHDRRAPFVRHLDQLPPAQRRGAVALSVALAALVLGSLGMLAVLTDRVAVHLAVVALTAVVLLAPRPRDAAAVRDGLAAAARGLRALGVRVRARPAGSRPTVRTHPDPR